MVQERQNPLDRIFDRLLSASSTEPYGLPIFKTFVAPPQGDKFDAFFAAYQASDWNIEEALKPYENEELESIVAFHDITIGQYKFCDWLTFCRLNGYHISLMQADD